MTLLKMIKQLNKSGAGAGQIQGRQRHMHHTVCAHLPCRAMASQADAGWVCVEYMATTALLSMPPTP